MRLVPLLALLVLPTVGAAFAAPGPELVYAFEADLGTGGKTHFGVVDLDARYKDVYAVVSCPSSSVGVVTMVPIDVDVTRSDAHTAQCPAAPTLFRFDSMYASSYRVVADATGTGVLRIEFWGTPIGG